MKIINKFKKSLISLPILLAIGGSTALGLSSCSDSKEIIVSCTEVPHSQILEKANAVIGGGYHIKTLIHTDYELENKEVSEGAADANFFQHHPYFEQYNSTASESDKLSCVLDVELEPIGLWNKTAPTLPGGVVEIYIPLKEDDYPRYFSLLTSPNEETAPIINADAPGTDKTDPSTWKSAIEGTQITINNTVKPDLIIQQCYDDNKWFVINGNFALTQGLDQTKCRYQESTQYDGTYNPYNNLIAVKKGNEGSLKTIALITALQNASIYNWIESEYAGAVIPCASLLPWA